MSTSNRNRRTSVSSNASSRSSWRVPLSKQQPRTQLSAVFAEIQPSRSPSTTSALALLESKISSSSPSDSASNASVYARSIRGHDPTAESEAALVSPSIASSRDGGNTLRHAENSESGWVKRGRQPTQRQISLAVDSTQELPVSAETDESSRIIIPPISAELMQPVSSVSTSPPPTSAQPPESVIGMDWQPTAIVDAPDISDNSRKRKQSSMTSGWFGSSGRSKSQRIQRALQKESTLVEEISQTPPPLSREDTITPSRPVPTTTTAIPEPSSMQPPQTIERSQPVPPMPSSTSGGWFSRSKTSTPAPLPNPPPVEVITPQPITVEATPVQRSDPIPSASTPITEVLPAPSPGRASWFGFARTQPSSLPPTQPNSSPSSALGTPLSPPVDLPAEPSLEESVIDESMMATVTPMSFAQAQAQAEAQTQASRNAMPTSWFKRGGKRDSMTPSIDSTVPSLPPSPKRAIASRHTTLVPVTNSSVYNSSPSSARYTLSSLVLGRPNAAVEGGNHPVEGMQVDTGLNNNPTLDITALTREPLAIKVIPESEPSSSAVASSAASVSSLNQSSANTSWWPVLPWSSVPNTAAEPKLTTDLSTAMIPAGVPSSAASSMVPSVGEELSKAMLSHEGVDGSISIQPIPNSASWFGFWPWSGQPPITLPEKTEAELIKEAAIARDANIASTPTIVPDAPENYQNPEQNPVSPDTVVNRSSWAYFFSLRSAHGARQITIDVQGEEIMDLDGDPDVPVDTPATGSMAPSVKGKSSAAPSGSASPIPKPRASSTGPAVKRNPPNPPLTDSESIRKKVVAVGKRSSSATPSKRSLPPPSAPKAPNMVLPTFEDTFYTLPRALPPHSRPTPLRKVGRIMSGVFGITNLGGPSTPAPSSEIREWQGRAGVHIPRDYENLRASREVGRDLPRVGEVLGIQDIGRIRDCKRVAILGVHGWFPGTIMRTLFGEPTGTSPKFASMMETAVLEFMEKQGIKLEKLTTMPLEGEGTIDRRVEKLYQDLLSRQDWVDDLHDADVVFVATHSQGSVVSTHLLEKLIADGHLRTSKNWEIVKTVAETSAGGIGMSIAPPQPPQRICCLALCGIHLGPLLYLGTSSIVNPYIQYFESAAARELFEFQDTESAISKKYLAALETVLDHGTKFVYVASLDDQVVPIYSGIFTAVNHPRILRALYIDGDAYSSSDFLSNLLVLLLRMRNAGIDDGGLITHLSEATAGSLSGIGHSTAYLDPGAYKLAVRFLFEASDALGEPPTLEFEPFTAKGSRNDYEIPWALRGLISDPRCQELFGKEIAELRNTFDSWQPKTSALKEVRRKLEPIRGRRSRFAPDPYSFYSQSSSSPFSPISPSQSTSTAYRH